MIPLELIGFLKLSFIDVLDIVMVAAIIYVAFRWLRGSSALNILIAIVALFILRFVAVALGRSLAMMLVGAALAAIGYGAANPSIQTLCIRTVEPERRGVASNTQFFGMDLGYFLGPALGGFIVAGSGYSAMYLCTGVIPQVICLILFVLTWRRLKKRLY